MWKILVVEDNDANRQFLVEVLADVAVCDQAVNGVDAFACFQAAAGKGKPYDLILLDIAMPQMDGLSFLEVLREFEAKEKMEAVPVIVVTAFDKPFLDAFDAGCDDYILKPVDPEQLLHKINMKLQGKR